MKLTGDATCPGCKKDHKVEFDLEKLDVKPIPSEVSNTSASNQATIQETKPEVIEKEVVKTVIEDFKPNYECPDGNCDVGVHKNKNYTKKPKGKCTNCGQFTKHDKGTCPWCKGTELEELDNDELEELGIIDPAIDEHEGHNHE